MKITIKYEESADQSLHMTLRLSLPQKTVNGPCKAIVKLFVDHYNKSHSDEPLDGDALHLKIVGGKHVDGETAVADVLASGDECFLMGDVTGERSQPVNTTTSSSVSGKSETHTNHLPKVNAPKLQTNADGMVRCKQLGCNRYFNPGGSPVNCRHHKAPPIFHETAKWWSCCPNNKAYDWDAFMAIPGCQEGFCSANPQGEQHRRALGGCDLRQASGPQRIDSDAPPNPTALLADLRKGLNAVGVDESLFNDVLVKFVSDGYDHQQICNELRGRFTALLNDNSIH